ncbi:hypothetical protein FGG08_003862 [Glutinoglossum americanum]|uniref:DOPA 4,5-dioxygenase n=1 Tax=Glutinoglossum americanum TaxID=1670608 RepID=A0A9P8ICI7_9PEZI|nr:hypothetical protein FGG08_003862 [Glutinoglossum americanum]
MGQFTSYIIGYSSSRVVAGKHSASTPGAITGRCRYNTDLSQYTYPSPLDGYKNLEPIPDTKNADKSYVNPQTGILSDAYQRFVDPISNHGPLPGFDIHIYFNPDDQEQTKFAQELWERIRREFPELRIYRLWYEPCGPHATGMFEVNLFTPAQFGAFVGWLVINRGPLSALVHPNTNDELRDHIQRYMWMGPEIPLNMTVFKLRGDA